MPNKLHPENISVRIEEITDIFYPDGSKPQSLIANTLPGNKELVEEVIRTADALIASGKVGSTALAQILKVKADSVVVLSQSREQELSCCLRQACALLSMIVAESGGVISTTTAQQVARFIMELNLLDSIKTL
jgi:hypothetical protein